MLKFDREKYLKIARDKSPEEALTALHRDIEQWEYNTFEGQKGYQPEMFSDLIDVREVSREIWDIALQEAPQSVRNS